MPRALRHAPALRLLLALWLALALAGTALAHRAAPAPADPALTAFLAAGGTLDDLCRDHGGGDHDDAPPCPACRPGLALLPTPAPGTPRPRAAPRAGVAWSKTQGRTASLRPARHGPRAPPARM